MQLMNALLLSLALLVPGADADKGVLPMDTDGKPLNFDFETGTLKDWTVEGEAFKDQPIEGDTVAKRRGDMKSDHQGKFWIGGFEKHTDKPTGTLTSVAFKVTHPWASFLVAGGNHPKDTCVELVDVAKKEVFFRVCGEETENLKRVSVDLSKMQSKEIQIRLVDTHMGHWGHLNFDDFRFHSDKPVSATAPAVDPYKYAGQKPLDAAKNMTVPEGFQVKLFAGEPDIHQPIAMCYDDRGRLWVVEAYVYPKRHPEKGLMIPWNPDRKEGGGREGDKILILEDTDGDGVHDKKTVFLEGLNLVSGIEYGFGGLWIGAAPYFAFIPILENDKPGEPKILLDGWGYQDTHETLNSFIWGPDGWLYGCHGVFTESAVGKPGTAVKDRTRINAGIWRYHPTKQTFEVYAHGTSNPWGLDYNDKGDWFAEACVIPHLWHIVQGGRYHRQAGSHYNPYTYDDIQTIAKHRHFQGGQWNPADRQKSNDLGGGHAHSGLLVYQGGLWPKEYHGKLFMGNIHGHRINVDEVKPKGSSYEGDRNPDFLLSHDKHCIIVNIQATPDGNIIFSDWSDKQVCHRNEPELWDRTNGRLFKVEYKDTKPLKSFDLQKLSDAELVKLQTSDNEWMVRHARRILQERSVNREPKASAEMVASLIKFMTDKKDVAKRLRALWALEAVGGIKWDLVAKCLTDESSDIRAWGYTLGSRVAVGAGMDFAYFKMLSDPSPVVRRHIASSWAALGGLIGANRLDALFQNADDATDPVLPQLYWYILEPLVIEKPTKALKVAANAKVKLFEKVTRRIGAMGTPEAQELLVEQFGVSTTDEHCILLLRGLQEALKVKQANQAPKGWDKVSALLITRENTEVKNATLALSVAYGDEEARRIVRDRLANTKSYPIDRIADLNTLLNVKDKQLPPVLQNVIHEVVQGSVINRDLRSAAIRALASFDDPKTPAQLLAIYPTCTATEKREIVATLASRAKYAEALLGAVEAKTLSTADIPAETIRQLRSFHDKALSAKIVSVWGTVRDTPADRRKLITDWTKKLTPTELAKADLGAGRAVFANVCAQCHLLYGSGGKVGPEITGANRADLGYLLENIFDPSAVIPKEYAATSIDLIDGRSAIGIIKQETATTLTLQTANEVLTFPLKDIEKRTPSDLSMMPNDLTTPLAEADIRNLIAYLKHTQQVPMLATAENAKDFFNGKDLTNWQGDTAVWSVEDGAIVGKTEKGLKANNFLVSQFDVTDFKLSLKVKLSPNTENSGIQFRSVPIEKGEMRGAQADIGKGWWGKLYEESARGLLVKNDNDKLVKENDWNEYIIEAVGPKVKLTLNGTVVCDYEDDKLVRRGQIAVQVHSGGPTDVRFKDIKLEVIGKKK
jgi:putative membrane-bound dehydrogenase-like protein